MFLASLQDQTINQEYYYLLLLHKAHSSAPPPTATVDSVAAAAADFTFDIIADIKNSNYYYIYFLALKKIFIV